MGLGRGRRHRRADAEPPHLRRRRLVLRRGDDPAPPHRRLGDGLHRTLGGQRRRLPPLVGRDRQRHIHRLHPHLRCLAVDYSAHIAHMFVVSVGSSRERAIKSLERIGPSVFNAVVSTLLAVVIIGFSTSYVFRVFFKALFLTVVLGGAHGLIFLPTVLGLFGGSKTSVATNAIHPDAPLSPSAKSG